MVTATSDPHAGRRGHVLAIEHEPFVAHALRLFLGDEHEIHVAASARQALSLLHGAIDYDVIFCDVSMPVWAGTDLHRMLAVVRPELARRLVLILPKAPDDPTRDRLARQRVAWIDKPPDPFALRALVRAKVAERQRSEMAARVGLR